MGSNSFGTLFTIITWGESHGKAIGVVIDGCPSGLELSEKEIQQELSYRRPGKNPYTSQRKEKDKVEILSGVFQGKTTGMPISIMIKNEGYNSKSYEPLKEILRPGHANFTYLEKYGIFDYRGAGRSSGRLTAPLVAAGAVAKKLLHHFHIDLVAYIKELGGLSLPDCDCSDINRLKKKVHQSPLYCPDKKTTAAIEKKLKETIREGDSLGAIIELIANPLPTGLGDPLFQKLQANLAKAMLSLPAAKGFEIGAGFLSARMKGSLHNDSFTLNNQKKIVTTSNFAGGTLGGITNGMPLLLRVAFKPTSSIRKNQTTLNMKKEVCRFSPSSDSRHDPCLALRAVPVVEAMGALVLADALLMNRVCRLEPEH